MIPSTGTLSPGKTRRISPIRTCSAGSRVSVPFRSALAVRGIKFTSFSIPALAFATVRSSSSAPSCMIKATSPAAKSSPMQTEAISARETSTSAFMSKRAASPISASRSMGTPHKMMAIQAASKGSGSRSKILITKAIAETKRRAMSFFTPPVSRICSIRPTKVFIRPSPFYTHRGIWLSYDKGYGFVKGSKEKAAIPNCFSRINPYSKTALPLW